MNWNKYVAHYMTSVIRPPLEKETKMSPFQITLFNTGHFLSPFWMVVWTDYFNHLNSVHARYLDPDCIILHPSRTWLTTAKTTQATACSAAWKTASTASTMNSHVSSRPWAPCPQLSWTLSIRNSSVLESASTPDQGSSNIAVLKPKLCK